eukprot:6238528-Prymnesium_polylepis.1
MMKHLVDDDHLDAQLSFALHVARDAEEKVQGRTAKVRLRDSCHTETKGRGAVPEWKDTCALKSKFGVGLTPICSCAWDRGEGGDETENLVLHREGIGPKQHPGDLALERIPGAECVCRVIGPPERNLEELNAYEQYAEDNDGDRQCDRPERGFVLQQEADDDHTNKKDELKGAHRVEEKASQALPLLPHQSEDEALHEVVKEHMLRAVRRAVVSHKLHDVVAPFMSRINVLQADRIRCQGTPFPVELQPLAQDVLAHAEVSHFGGKLQGGHASPLGLQSERCPLVRVANLVVCEPCLAWHRWQMVMRPAQE